ncbi:eCIS core domain-containing protein [Paraburkholderia atlantica]|uniref:eCIS core domain-containing protein n=1 Tax=Paraburkholderia atlantica TaxID=2654982 RepID=UPI0016156DE9|nr:DUF4157 domain-containing protein [Paraburkholderia atlantica]MBB5511135.1 hypothetical protein [Paraburkholderia atlantica]
MNVDRVSRTSNTRVLKKSLMAAGLVAGALAMTAPPVYAGCGFIACIINQTAGSLPVVGPAVKQVTAPADVTYTNLVHGNVGGAVSGGGQVIISAGAAPATVVSTLGRGSGNPVISQLANAYASTATINSDALGTVTIVGGNIIAGQDPRQVYAAPLAAAIHQARDAHIDDAEPIPDSVKEALRGTIPDDVLENARYATGHLEITVANAINRSHVALGDDGYAVTVDDVIVFSDPPSSDPDETAALHWWAHELTHVWQYSRWGVERFALNYMNNYSAVEKEAENYAFLAVDRYAAVAAASVPDQ